MSDKTKHSEPLIRISKRDGLIWWKSWLVRVAAVALALVLCSVIIILITGYNPVQVYYAMIRGSFGTARKFWIMLQNLAMLLCISLAVTPAFKMRFWNIGAEGQVLVGGLATAAVMFYVGDRLPTALMIVIMLAASLAAGYYMGDDSRLFQSKMEHKRDVVHTYDELCRNAACFVFYYDLGAQRLQRNGHYQPEQQVRLAA